MKSQDEVGNSVLHQNQEIVTSRALAPYCRKKFQVVFDIGYGPHCAEVTSFKKSVVFSHCEKFLRRPL